MQHNLHHHLKRPFTAAAHVLDITASAAHELRAALHYELAKCDAADDLLAPAKQQALAALRLDYPGNPQESEHFHLERPLDRHLQPLLESLCLRTNVYDTPSDDISRAILCISRARDSKIAVGKQDALTKAMSLLRNLALEQPPSAPDSSQDAVERTHRARKLTALWADALKVAYQARMHTLVLEAGPFVTWFEWHASVDREMTLLQVWLLLYLIDGIPCVHPWNAASRGCF